MSNGTLSSYKNYFYLLMIGSTLCLSGITVSKPRVFRLPCCNVNHLLTKGPEQNDNNFFGNNTIIQNLNEHFSRILSAIFAIIIDPHNKQSRIEHIKNILTTMLQVATTLIIHYGDPNLHKTIHSYTIKQLPYYQMVLIKEFHYLYPLLANTSYDQPLPPVTMPSIEYGDIILETATIDRIITYGESIIKADQTYTERYCALDILWDTIEKTGMELHQRCSPDMIETIIESD